MKHVEYQTNGVCAKIISFDLTEDLLIKNLVFTGGCPGNLSAISKLLEGAKAVDATHILKGNTCHTKNTSCADQLAKALEQALAE